MNPVDFLRGLSTVAGAYVAAGGPMPAMGGTLGSLVNVATGEAFADFRAVLADFLSQSKEADVDELIAELDRKRAAIRAGRALRELTDDELTAYSALGDLRHVATAEDLLISMNEASIEDFVRTVVPVVKELAPIVLTLLV